MLQILRIYQDCRTKSSHLLPLPSFLSPIAYYRINSPYTKAYTIQFRGRLFLRPAFPLVGRDSENFARPDIAKLFIDYSLNIDEVITGKTKKGVEYF